MRKSIIKYTDVIEEFIRVARTHPVIFFDLETTGLRPMTDRILSFSAVKCVFDGSVCRETDRLDLFINPGFHIPDKATEVNGITDEMVKGQPREQEAYRTIKAFLGDDYILCGYNSVSFDRKFMEALYMRRSGESFDPFMHLDVMKMAREKLDCPDYRLQTVTHEMGSDAGLSFHRSIDDVIATMRVFNLLLAYYVNRGDKKRTYRLRVKDIRFWGPRHDLRRIYITTAPYSKTYYDLYRKEWITDVENADMDSLRTDVLAIAQAADEKELAIKAPHL